MTELDMLFGARKLLTVCTRTQPGESVVIVTDPETRALAEPLAIAAAEVGAEPTICVMPTRIGIGTNITLGGKIKAKVHYDLLMHGATLLVDGEAVLQDGQLAFV